jgi:Protein of unknown function (DUF1573)
MTMLRVAAFLLFFLWVGQYTLMAQPSPKDLRPLLKTLSTAQREELLSYLRQLSKVSLDDQIQAAYERLTPAARESAVRLTEVERLRSAGKPLPLTTAKWDRDTLRFGAVEEGEILLDSFTVTNTGTQPYVISHVSTGCDCTVLRLPEYPVMPGETAVVRIEFNTVGKAGLAQPGIVLYDNSLPNYRSIVYLKGTITPRRNLKGPR